MSSRTATRRITTVVDIPCRSESVLSRLRISHIQFKKIVDGILAEPSGCIVKANTESQFELRWVPEAFVTLVNTYLQFGSSHNHSKWKLMQCLPDDECTNCKGKIEQWKKTVLVLDKGHQEKSKQKKENECYKCWKIGHVTKPSFGGWAVTIWFITWSISLSSAMVIVCWHGSLLCLENNSDYFCEMMHQAFPQVNIHSLRFVIRDCRSLHLVKNDML